MILTFGKKEETPVPVTPEEKKAHIEQSKSVWMTYGQLWKEEMKQGKKAPRIKHK